MKKQEKKTILILLTRHYDNMSKFIYFTTGYGYTHASIGLDGQESCFYSFNRKGFRIEHPKNLLKKRNNVPSALYEIEIPSSMYNIIKNRIENVNNNSKNYKYSHLGVLFCLWHIKHRLKNKYFCSQFVAELLLISGAIKLKKDPSLYLPNMFIEDLKKHPGLKFIKYDFLDYAKG